MRKSENSEFSSCLNLQKKEEIFTDFLTTVESQNDF